MSVAVSEASTVQPEPIARRGVTWRGVMVGLVVVCCEIPVISFSEPVAASSQMNISHFPIGFFMWFVALVLFVNTLLKRIHWRYALSPEELLTVAAMGVMGAHVPGSGLMGFFLGMLSAPYYFASPENGWADLIHPHLSAWVAPPDTGGAMVAFYEGAREGFQIPWMLWAMPMFWWMCMIGALSFALLCLAVALRKQWVEHERLVYPLLSPVAELIEGSDAREFLPRIAKNRLFWVGFAIGFGILAWNMVYYFWDAWPRINYFGRKDWVFIRDFPRMTNRINMYIIGFGYFANVDVLFSLWFFYLIYWAQTGVYNRLGVDLGPGSRNAPAWESAGALFALVIWGLWVARWHLWNVVQKAWNPKAGVDDSREMLSYRTAVVGFLLGSAFVLFWLRSVGIDYGVGILLLLFLYITYLGLAKIVSESGLLYLSWVVTPQALVAGVLGFVRIPESSIVAMSLTNGLSAHGKGIFLSGFVQGAKMADRAGDDPKRIALGMGLALLVGIPLCFALSLIWGYEYGAYNFAGSPFRNGVSPFRFAAGLIQTPEDIPYLRLAHFLIGAVAMSALTLLRYRLHWWSINPIGMAALGRATKTVFSIFLVWAFKSLVLRIGGVTLYQRFRPMFAGLLAGYSLGIGLSFVVDVIWFPGNGHWIHLY